MKQALFVWFILAPSYIHLWDYLTSKACKVSQSASMSCVYMKYICILLYMHKCWSAWSSQRFDLLCWLLSKMLLLISAKIFRGYSPTKESPARKDKILKSCAQINKLENVVNVVLFKFRLKPPTISKKSNKILSPYQYFGCFGLRQPSPSPSWILPRPWLHHWKAPK